MVAVINFFGHIECENITHEVRGLNVVVRLHKLGQIMWPRLLLAADKCSWITQNLEKFADEREMDDDDTNSGSIGNIQWNFILLRYHAQNIF